MYQIINVKDYSGGLEKAARYIHGKWGNDTNYLFYRDAMANSSNSEQGLPRFYLLTKNNDIVGCYALIVNDFISRHDLMPWFACLFVEKDERGKKLSGLMFDHAIREAKKSGFATIYLTTDLDGFYEKFGWERIEDGYDIRGQITRIYKRSIS